MRRVTALVEFGEGYVRNLDTERSVEIGKAIGKDSAIFYTILPGETRYLSIEIDASEGWTARVLRKPRKKSVKR